MGRRLACLDEYQKFVNKMNTPRVVVDNSVCTETTVVKVDSCREQGMLLEVVQFLTDLDLTINKGYVSSDGRWFMDVFHVTDSRNSKLSDPSLLSLIEHSLAANTETPDESSVGATTLELTGSDRPGLLSEVFAVLRDFDCNVVDAKVWTHNSRIAALIYVNDSVTANPVIDSTRIECIEARLRHVLKGDHDVRGGRTTVAENSVTHVDRRLHQLMFADRDYDRVPGSNCSYSRPLVSVQNWMERGYSVVNIQCRDRAKLLFDIVCTLTDMQYVVFHGTIATTGDRAYQEYCIRHLDGSPISSEAERQRVIQCLQAAIERRSSEGLRLELCTIDRRGLLADVTRTFRENGLSVTRADVSTTKDGMTNNVFYVIDTAGNLPDRRIINAVIDSIGIKSLKLNEEGLPWQWQKQAVSQDGNGAGLFNFGSLVKRNLSYLGLIGSCS